MSRRVVALLVVGLAGTSLWAGKPRSEARAVAAAPAAPDAPTLAEAIAAAPDAKDPDALVPKSDPVDAAFEAELVHREVLAGAAELAVGDAELWRGCAEFLEGVARLATAVDEGRVFTSVDPVTAPAAPSLAAEPATGAPGLRGYHADLQRAFLKYGSDGVIPASSVKWLAETYDRRIVEVAHDLRQMARNAGVIIPEVERTDPPPPEPTTPAVIPVEVVAEGESPGIQGAYLHALERVLEKYDLVRLVPDASVRFLARAHERSEDAVRADLKRLAKPEAEAVLPDYAY